MTLVKFKPATANHFNSFNPLFESFWNNSISDLLGRESLSVPAVNVAETADAFIIELAAPGQTKDRFDLGLNYNRAGHPVLTIKAKVHEQAEPIAEEHTAPKVKYLRREFGFMQFERSFTLPLTTEVDAISANYQDGILFINIPKKEEAKAKAPRTIEIG